MSKCIRKDLKGLAQAIKNAWNYDGFIIDPYNFD